jgi:hypothetical protein
MTAGAEDWKVLPMGRRIIGSCVRFGLYKYAPGTSHEMASNTTAAS